MLPHMFMFISVLLNVLNPKSRRGLRPYHIGEFGMELVRQTAFDSFYLARKNESVQANVESFMKEYFTVKV